MPPAVDKAVGPIKRILPGRAMRDNNDKIPFYKGRVIYASERIQWIQTNHPEHKLVYLIADTYLYWCDRCKISVWEQEVMTHGVRRCPFCLGRILALSPGDTVRLHYRYNAKPKNEAGLTPADVWGAWWAERWEW